MELAALINLAEALDVRDWGSASHCRRVGRFAELTARELGLSPEAVERVRLAGILHDVGRVALPERLLVKQEPLTDDEWVLVRAHPVAGARMVETTEYDDIRSWILFHHERPDGTGYPEGRGESEVPLESSIIAVADAYEAMTSDRPYRPALAPEDAGDELRREAGRQFRADVVDGAAQGRLTQTGYRFKGPNLRPITSRRWSRQAFSLRLCPPPAHLCWRASPCTNAGA